MRNILQACAALGLVAAVGLWLATGASRGWTKNSVAVKRLDEVTGIEGIEYEKRFVPGVDFLGLAASAAVLLAGVSFFFRNKPTSPETKP